MISETYNTDCLEAMRAMDDNHWDLAICDPPYGIGEQGHCRTRKKHNYTVVHASKKWDFERPSVEYFQELFRVSKNQIIWGANYFTQFLPASMGWIFWDKQIGGDFSDGELAFTSQQRALKVFTQWNGNNGIARIHPTQKPVALYKWLLTNYAKPGDTILDTHGGSFSSRIACWDLGFDFTGFEMDKSYFDAAEKRFADHIAQPKLFMPTPQPMIQEAMQFA